MLRDTLNMKMDGISRRGRPIIGIYLTCMVTYVVIKKKKG